MIKSIVEKIRIIKNRDADPVNKPLIVNAPIETPYRFTNMFLLKSAGVAKS